MPVNDGPVSNAPRSLVPPADWLHGGRSPDTAAGAGYLALVTALALALRLLRLDGMSLWVDEMFTWDLVAPGRDLRFFEQILAAYQGPLYHAAVWPLVRLGDPGVMLRLPAALAGAAAVPLIGALTASLWGRSSGRLAALLLAVNPFAIWYAQEGRGYAFVLLFAAAGGLVMVQAARGGMTGRRAVLLALLGFGGLGGNFSFLFLLAAFALTVPLVARPAAPRQWLVWAAGLGGGVLLALPWLLEAAGIWEVGRVVPGAATGEALRGASTFHPGAVPFALFALVNGFTLGPSLADLHGGDPWAAVTAEWPAIVLGTVPVAVALLLSLRRLDRGRWAMLLWIVVPLACVVLLAMRNIKPFNVRYVAAAQPWLLVLAAAGVGALRGRRHAALAVVLLGVSLWSTGSYFLDDRYAKEDIRGAVAAMHERGGADLPVLAPGVGPVVRYYREDGGEVLGCWDEPTVAGREEARALVARQLGRYDEAWVLSARAWYLDPAGHLPAALAEAGALERVFAGPGVTLDHWRRTAAAEGTP